MLPLTAVLPLPFVPLLGLVVVLLGLVVVPLGLVVVPPGLVVVLPGLVVVPPGLVVVPPGLVVVLPPGLVEMCIRDSHIAFRHSDILLENLCRSDLVVADKIERLVDIAGTIPVEFRQIFVSVIVVEIIEHPLVCQKAAADVCLYFFIPRCV